MRKGKADELEYDVLMERNLAGKPCTAAISATPHHARAWMLAKGGWTKVYKTIQYSQVNIKGTSS